MYKHIGNNKRAQLTVDRLPVEIDSPETRETAIRIIEEQFDVVFVKALDRNDFPSEVEMTLAYDETRSRAKRPMDSIGVMTGWIECYNWFKSRQPLQATANNPGIPEDSTTGNERDMGMMQAFEEIENVFVGDEDARQVMEYAHERSAEIKRRQPLPTPKGKPALKSTKEIAKGIVQESKIDLTDQDRIMIEMDKHLLEVNISNALLTERTARTIAGDEFPSEEAFGEWFWNWKMSTRNPPTASDCYTWLKALQPAPPQPNGRGEP